MKIERRGAGVHQMSSKETSKLHIDFLVLCGANCSGYSNNDNPLRLPKEN